MNSHNTRSQKLDKRKVLCGTLSSLPLGSQACAPLYQQYLQGHQYSSSDNSWGDFYTSIIYLPFNFSAKGSLISITRIFQSVSPVLGRKNIYFTFIILFLTLTHSSLSSLSLTHILPLSPARLHPPSLSLHTLINKCHCPEYFDLYDLSPLGDPVANLTDI